MANNTTIQLIAGVDEAGRGPLAGPVFAAAVILDPQFPIQGLADSKQLSEKNVNFFLRNLREGQSIQHCLCNGRRN